jgi:hypothetical protein
MTAPPPPRKKKRVRPARKIVPRGRMGIQWIIGPIVMAAAILILGIIFLLTRSR